jgi:hypothetical protein
MGLGCPLLVNRMVLCAVQNGPSGCSSLQPAALLEISCSVLPIMPRTAFSTVRSGFRYLAAHSLVVFFLVYFLGHPAILHTAIPSGAWSSWRGNVISGAPLFVPLLLPNLAILGFLGLHAYERNQRTGDCG